ncbi:MAG: ABC transporter substrate-binding protein [Acidobacteriota bacterium]
MLRPFVASAVLACLTLSAAARTRPHYGGTLRIETQADAWQMSDGIARRLVLDTLTTVSDAGGVQAALAVRWEPQNAAHRWEFWIRPGVHFQDGEALTSDVVAAALTDVCSRGTAGKCPWRTVRAVGATVVFVSDSPVPDLPALLAQTEYAIARQAANGAVVGTGPFRVTGFANGVLTLAANDDCWSGRPFADGVELRTRRLVRDQWLDFSVGKADIVELPPELLRQAQQQHMNVLVSRPVDLLALRVTPSGPFADRELRRAAALAVDRTALFNVIFQKQGEVTASLLPRALSGYSFLFSTDRDLERARALRGGTTTAPLQLGVEASSAAAMSTTGQVVAERLALNLHEAGFNVQVAPAGSRPPWALMLQRVHLEATDLEAALDEMLARFGENGSVTGTDAASLWREEGTVLDNGTIIPLLWLPRGWGVGDRVRDLRLLSDGEPDLSDASLEGAK